MFPVKSVCVFVSSKKNILTLICSTVMIVKTACEDANIKIHVLPGGAGVFGPKIIIFFN